MKIYDISQEVFSCEVYPGDMKPTKETISSIGNESICNVTAFQMCAHNGTHVDAPYHFYNDGKTIDKISLEHFIGKCYVIFDEGIIDEKKALNILNKAKSLDKEAARRILIGGDIVVSLDAAKIFANDNILLLGNESVSVGDINAPAKVHYELLKKDIVLLEGIRLNNIHEGIYLLNCAPLNLGDSDGAPCRAILLEE